MRKLNILKAIVDFFWIVSLPLIPLLLLLMGFVVFDNSLQGFSVRINGVEIESFDGFSKGIMIAMMFSYLIIMYCLFLFRRVLVDFKKVNLFNNNIIENFSKIGFWLIIAAFLDGLPTFLYKVMYQQKIGFEIGFSSFLILLCFGLFFMVLSEVFKIAKNAKQENDLTI